MRSRRRAAAKHKFPDEVRFFLGEKHRRTYSEWVHQGLNGRMHKEEWTANPETEAIDLVLMRTRRRVRSDCAHGLFHGDTRVAILNACGLRGATVRSDRAECLAGCRARTSGAAGFEKGTGAGLDRCVPSTRKTTKGGRGLDTAPCPTRSGGGIAMR